MPTEQCSCSLLWRDGQDGPIAIDVELTIEGIQKADGTLPTLTYDNIGSSFAIFEMNANTTFKNLNLIIKNARSTGSLVVKNGATLTMDGVNITLAELTSYNAICVIRLYKEGTNAIIRNCKVTYTDAYWSSLPSAFIMFDYDFADRTVIIENTTIDASKAASPVSIVGADENPNNNVTIKNSVLFTSQDAPIFLNLTEGKGQFKV